LGDTTNQKPIQNADVIRQWVDILARWGDDPADIPRVLDLLDDECEWILMATSEHFKGKEAIKKMSEKSAAAVRHSAEHELQVTNIFAYEDKGCLEYVHRALLMLPGQVERSPIEMPICIVFLFKNRKILRAQEYYEVQQMYGSTVKPLYSDVEQNKDSKQIM
jgi:ketosteroid isomerase-like protein